MADKRDKEYYDPFNVDEGEDADVARDRRGERSWSDFDEDRDSREVTFEVGERAARQRRSKREDIEIDDSSVRIGEQRTPKGNSGRRITEEQRRVERDPIADSPFEISYDGEVELGSIESPAKKLSRRERKKLGKNKTAELERRIAMLERHKNTGIEWEDDSAEKLRKSQRHRSKGEVPFEVNDARSGYEIEDQREELISRRERRREERIEEIAELEADPMSEEDRQFTSETAELREPSKFTAYMGSLLSGNILSKPESRKLITVIVFAAAMAFLYISNNFQMVRLQRNEMELVNMNKELRAKHLTIMSIKMKKTRESEVIKELRRREMNLNEAIAAPSKVFDK